MKFLIAAAGLLALAACAMPPQYPLAKLMYSGTPGNPHNTQYVGSQGSAYDSAVNPPANLGKVTYDPNAPVTPPAAPTPATSVPVTPAPNPPAAQ
jgi:hypothetical protein